MRTAERQNWTRALAVTLLMMASPPLLALGLGEATVHSHMRQPLDVRIRLISRSEAELASVSARLASAEDFRMIGLDRELLTVPLELSVNADLGDPYVQVRSELPVNDPVVQLVLEVVWASGRMLRQYTLFLDPPTFESVAPLPSPTRAPAEQDRREQAASEAQGAQVDQAGPPFQPAPAEPESTPPAVSEVAIDAEPEPAMEREREPETVSTEPPAGTEEEPAYRAVLSDPATPGTGDIQVRRGDTLWGIATRWGRQRGYGTNQVMLAIQQQNPGAFIRDNINLLKAGEVLRMPSEAQIDTWGFREAMLEVIRQEDLWLNRPGYAAQARDLPTITSLEGASDGPAEGGSRNGRPEEGHLELVPPTGPGREGGLGQGNSDDSGGTRGESLVEEELARAQEELANARQENDYLSERIRELEDELARRDTTVGVEDTGMAEMEQRLREDRLDGDAGKQQVAVVSPRDERPWYAGLSGWVVGLLLLAAVGLAGWLVKRRRDGPEALADVEPYSDPDPGAPGDEEDPGAEEGDDNVVEMDRFKNAPARARSFERPASGEEAVELDSDDPETKLDLARAYISMGDTEAARAILEEVVESGSEAQVAEAQSMLDEL